MTTYPFFQNRETSILDGLWDFQWLGESAPPLKNFRHAKIVFSEKASVPGVFDMENDLYCKRGLALYRTFVGPVSKGKYRLHVGGLGLAARVFFDGSEIGQVNCPYADVKLDFIQETDVENAELLIAVDNRFQAQPYQFFRDFYDFYGFGGVYRSVELSTLPQDGFIDRIQVFTEDYTCGKVRLHFLFHGVKDGTVQVKLSFDGEHTQTVALSVADGAADDCVTVPKFKLWTTETPNLHTLTAEYSGDSITERFGIRQISVKDRQICLNGQKIYLNGVNRHESHPEFGPVQSLQQMVGDLKLIRQAGMNFIRCVHYPQDDRFLSLCDEYGILLWVESLGWGLNAEALNTQTLPLFMAENARMIQNGINHPSVIIWAMLNECASHLEESAPLYRELLKDMKKQDPSRLRSFASCRGIEDKCLDEVDVISMNTYPGWFMDIRDSETLASEYIPANLKRLGDFYSAQDFHGKPLLISEIGACGIYGSHDRNLAQWTEEFQADFMSEAVKAMKDNENICGFALWQFCDSRSYIRGQIRGKPYGYNFAGLVDGYRRPKMSYFAVADCLNGDRGCLPIGPISAHFGPFRLIQKK